MELYPVWFLDWKVLILQILFYVRRGFQQLLAHQTLTTNADCGLLYILSHYTALFCALMVLQCTKLYCTALHFTALHCTALHCTALYYTALHCTALHCTILNRTALHFTKLYTAQHYLHKVAVNGGFIRVIEVVAQPKCFPTVGTIVWLFFTR